MDMNATWHTGNLTRDPVLTTTATGKSVCRFTIACNRIKSKDSDKSEADYIPVVCWDNNAENAMKYLKKGYKVGVKGRLKSSKYTDANGKTVFKLEVEPEKYGGLMFMSNGSKNTDESTLEETALGIDEESSYMKVETDQLPF